MSIPTYVTRTVSLAVLPAGADLYHAQATRISLEDEGAGAYVRIRQSPDGEPPREIAINPEEWLVVRAAIDAMVEECGKLPDSEA